MWKKKWVCRLCIGKKISVFFKGKSVESLSSKLQEREVNHNSTFLSTKSFLVRVVLRPLLQIFLKNNEIDFFCFFWKINVWYARKNWDWYVLFIFLKRIDQLLLITTNTCVMNDSG